MNEKDAAMFRLIRLWRLALLGSLLVLAWGACQPDTSSSQKVAPAPTLTSPRSLIVWHALSQNERVALEDLRRNFEATHPHIDVQLVPHSAEALLPTFQQQVLAGAGPDLLILQYTDMPGLVATGLIQPLDEALLDALTLYQTEIAFEAGTFDRTTYGVILTTEFPTLYYRRSLFTPSYATPEDFLAQMQTAGLVIPPTFTATGGFLLAADPDPLDDDGPSRPALLSYFTTLSALNASPLIHFTTDPTLFLNGSAAVLVASSSDYPQLANVLGDDLGVAAWPDQGWYTPIRAGTAVAISLNITRESARAANQFLACLLAPESQALWHAQTGQAPANPYGLPEKDLLSAWGHTLRRGVSLPATLPDVVQRLKVLDTAITEVVSGHLEPDGAADYVLDAFSDTSK